MSRSVPTDGVEGEKWEPRGDRGTMSFDPLGMACTTQFRGWLSAVEKDKRRKQEFRQNTGAASEGRSSALPIPRTLRAAYDDRRWG
jgi:hypothetical protein